MAAWQRSVAWQQRHRQHHQHHQQHGSISGINKAATWHVAASYLAWRIWRNGGIEMASKLAKAAISMSCSVAKINSEAWRRDLLMVA